MYFPGIFPTNPNRDTTSRYMLMSTAFRALWWQVYCTTKLMHNLGSACFWPGWVTTDKIVLFLADCPQSWLSTERPHLQWAGLHPAGSGKPETNLYGLVVLTLASILPLEGTVEEAPDWGGVGVGSTKLNIISRGRWRDNVGSGLAKLVVWDLLTTFQS